MEELPVEVVHHLVYTLPILTSKDVVSLACTSKTMHYLLLSDPFAQNVVFPTSKLSLGFILSHSLLPAASHLLATLPPPWDLMTKRRVTRAIRTAVASSNPTLLDTQVAFVLSIAHKISLHPKPWLDVQRLVGERASVEFMEVLLANLPSSSPWHNPCVWLCNPYRNALSSGVLEYWVCKARCGICDECESSTDSSSGRADVGSGGKKKEWSLLETAVARDVVCVVAALLAMQDPLLKADAGILFHAIEQNASRVFAWLFEEHFSSGSVVNTRGLYGATLLMVAIARSRDDMVSLLLAHPEIRVNQKADAGGTALHTAVEKGTHKALDLLLAHPDLDVNVSSAFGDTTPLHTAAMHCNVHAVLRFMAIPEIDVNAVASGVTALHTAIAENDVEIVQILLDNPEVDVNVLAHNNQPPLFIPCFRGWKEIVRILISHPDLDVNACTVGDGRTPLHYAAGRGFTDVVSLLLSRPDLDPSIVDSAGLSPLDFALRHQRTSIVTLLTSSTTTPSTTSSTASSTTPSTTPSTTSSTTPSTTSTS